MITQISSLSDVAALRQHINLAGYIFRGQSDYSWDLDTKIQRPANHAIRSNELQVYGQFRQALQCRSLPVRPTQSESAGQWLALMQHYGLPTRLLDWTKDFLVALHFACSDYLTCDGAVYVLNPFPLYQAVNSTMRAIPSMFFAPETIPYFNFPEPRYLSFVAGQGEGGAVVAPISPLAPNEREQIQGGVFTVSNVLANPQDSIIQRLLLAADDFVKVRIKQAAKADIIQMLKSQHGLSTCYLMSPIEELARRLGAKYP